MKKNLPQIGLLITHLFIVGTSAAQSKEDWPSPIPEMYTGRVLFDRLEYTHTDNDENRAVWDMQAWYGGDHHRLVFKSEGENTQNDGLPTDLERAELLYGYLISSFWSLQAGIGTSGELSSDTSMENYAVISYQGLAPYWFEMENSIRINEEGDIQFISETEYDWQLSQVSFLQPRLELVANLTGSEKFDRLSGLSNVRLGLRYRHEVTREFAPYVGLYYSKALGRTADQLSSDGESTSEKGLVIGARMWF